ncbi:hypothetical protein PDL71_15145 [Lacibacter sp. MH-610]|uniref:hypothetical protein n=1 Tax=Lacibacter sp. MH-610 TaxID=3020883 RepID=UPI003891B387
MRRYKGKLIGLLVVMLVLSSGSLVAQLNHFLYLQSDNNQPFYIRYNSKIISSTSSGYLILSKLKEGSVEIIVGFPQSKQPEQPFQINVDKTEKGYLIKNFGEKGWGLFDLQTAAVVYAASPAAVVQGNSTTPATKPADDPFANMLSNVTQDTTVKNVTVKKQEPKPDTPKLVTAPVKTEIKQDTPKPVVTESKPDVVTTPPVQEKIQKVDTPLQQTITPMNPGVKDTVVKVQEPVQQEPVWTAPSKTPVQQIRKFESREGVDCVFEVTETNGRKDTIRIFIAADSSFVQTEVKEEPVTEIKKDTIVPVQQQVLPKTEEKKEEIKQTVDTPLVVKEQPKTEPSAPALQVTKPVADPVTETKPAAIPNSNCKDNAGEDDFMKLRKRMAAQSKEEAMVSEAKKVFKTKCFSTTQLKNLAVLFLTDEWRYRFYDAALPFVSDFGSFKSLGDTITDDYYRKRFQALLPNQ